MGHYDCSAREAARQNYEAAKAEYETAKAAYDAAVALQESLNTEQANIQGKMDQYDAIYNQMEAAGKSFLTEANVGYLKKGFDCLSKYSSAVSEAQTKCDNEVTTCKTTMDKAETAKNNAMNTYAHTQCVWVSDAPSHSR